MKDILKNKKMIIAFAVLALILTVVFFIRRKRKAEEADKAIAGGGSSATSSGVATLPATSFPLTPYSIAKEYTASAGSYGQQIANLQKICNDKFGKGLDVDGKFGPKSEAAFLTCFGSPYKMPYSEEVYNGLMLQHGGGLNLA